MTGIDGNDAAIHLRPMTEYELTRWFMERGVVNPDEMTRLVTENRGKTLGQMDELYSSMHPSE